MEDEELRWVLVSGVGKAGLAFSDMSDIDAVIARIAQKRRMPGFGNAGTVNSMIDFAKAAKSKRIGEAQKAYDAAIKEGITSWRCWTSSRPSFCKPRPTAESLLTRSLVPSHNPSSKHAVDCAAGDRCGRGGNNKV